VRSRPAHAASGVPSGVTASAASATSTSIERRAVEAVLTCVAWYGVAKTTLDDVAREAGCARATLYRYFPGKQQLLAAAVGAEVERVASELQAVAAECATLEDAVVGIVAHAAREVTGHDALQFVLRHELQVLLPHLTFEGGDRLLSVIAAAVAPAVAPFLPADRVERSSEWIARVTLAYLMPHGSRVSMTDETQVRELVADFVLPGLVPQPSQPVRG